jgi:Flp pilus assembly protein TadG
MRPAQDSRGAIYAEYAVAIVPMFFLFWGLLQVNGLLLADLILRDAAIKAVRAAVVCDSDEHTSGTSGAIECAQQAVNDIIKAQTSIVSADVTGVTGAASSGNQRVTVTVVGHYACTVPLVGAFVCGAFGGGTSSAADLTRTATLPNQGAYYRF